jgi:hypothetical protein
VQPKSNKYKPGKQNANTFHRRPSSEQTVSKPDTDAEIKKMVQAISKERQENSEANYKVFRMFVGGMTVLYCFSSWMDNHHPLHNL